MLTSEIHQHLSTGFTQGAYSKGLLCNSYYGMKNDILPQYNANTCVQQSHLQIFLWKEESYTYFADEKTETSTNGEGARNEDIHRGWN